MEYCKFSEYMISGGQEFLKCKLCNDYCGFQRYCPKERLIVNTDSYITCKLKVKEEKKQSDLDKNKIDDKQEESEVSQIDV